MESQKTTLEKNKWLESIKDKTQSEIRKTVLDMEPGVDRDRALALWAVHYADFEGLLPLTEPPRPVRLKVYDSMTPRQKQEFDWENEEVKHYLNQCQEVFRNNRSNTLWLKQLVKWLSPKEDSMEIRRIENKLKDFTVVEMKLQTIRRIFCEKQETSIRSNKEAEKVDKIISRKADPYGSGED